MKRNVWLVIALSLALTLVGIGPTGAQEEGVTIMLWHAWQDAEADLLYAWIDNFQAANPGVTIDTLYTPFDDLRNRFTTAAATGEGPDMLIGPVDWIGPFAEAGLIRPLNDVITLDLYFQVVEPAWGVTMYEGQVYGVPESAKNIILYYNPSLIDTPPQTWEEMLDICAEFGAVGEVGLEFNPGFYHTMGYFFAFGGQLMDEEGNNIIDQGDAAIRYLELLADLYQRAQDPANGIVIEGTNDLFRQGAAAMIFDGPWNLGTYRADLGEENVAVTLMPAVDGTYGKPLVGTENFFFSADISDEALAAGLDFMRYVTSPEGQLMAQEVAGHIPIGVGVEYIDEDIEGFAAQAAIGTPFPNRPEMSAYWEPMGNAITAVMEGGVPPEDALAEAVEAINAAIASMHEE